jgi:hypothetical protein
MKTLQKFVASSMMVLAMMVSVVGGYSLAAQIPVNAQINLPDTCPPGGCPVLGDETIDPNSVNEGTVANFILGIASFITYIVIALAVLFLVYGGFLFVTDSGDGKRAENGKKILFNALIGLVLAIVAFTIVSVISNLVAGDLVDVQT